MQLKKVILLQLTFTTLVVSIGTHVANAANQPHPRRVTFATTPPQVFQPEETGGEEQAIASVEPITNPVHAVPTWDDLEAADSARSSMQELPDITDADDLPFASPPGDSAEPKRLAPKITPVTPLINRLAKGVLLPGQQDVLFAVTKATGLLPDPLQAELGAELLSQIGEPDPSKKNYVRVMIGPEGNSVIDGYRDQKNWIAVGPRFQPRYLYSYPCYAEGQPSVKMNLGSSIDKLEHKIDEADKKACQNWIVQAQISTLIFGDLGLFFDHEADKWSYGPVSLLDDEKKAQLKYCSCKPSIAYIRDGTEQIPINYWQQPGSPILLGSYKFCKHCFALSSLLGFAEAISDWIPSADRFYPIYPFLRYDNPGAEESYLFALE